MRFPRGLFIGLLQIRRIAAKLRGASVVAYERLPVAIRPLTFGHLRLADPLREAARRANRDREPCRPSGSFDAISITPVVLGELDRIENDELIYRTDQVEVSLPWNIVRLQDSDGFHRHTAGLPQAL